MASNIEGVRNLGYFVQEVVKIRFELNAVNELDSSLQPRSYNISSIFHQIK